MLTERELEETGDRIMEELEGFFVDPNKETRDALVSSIDRYWGAPKPSWSSTPPTEAGPCWFRPSDKYPARMVHVYPLVGEVWEPSDGDRRLDKYKGQWQSLEVPE